MDLSITFDLWYDWLSKWEKIWRQQFIFILFSAHFRWLCTWFVKFCSCKHWHTLAGLNFSRTSPHVIIHTGAPSIFYFILKCLNDFNRKGYLSIILFILHRTSLEITILDAECGFTITICTADKVSCSKKKDWDLKTKPHTYLQSCQSVQNRSM